MAVAEPWAGERGPAGTFYGNVLELPATRNVTSHKIHLNDVAINCMKLQPGHVDIGDHRHKRAFPAVIQIVLVHPILASHVPFASSPKSARHDLVDQAWHGSRLVSLFRAWGDDDYEVRGPHP